MLHPLVIRAASGASKRKQVDARSEAERSAAPLSVASEAATDNYLLSRTLMPILTHFSSDSEYTFAFWRLILYIRGHIRFFRHIVMLYALNIIYENDLCLISHQNY